MAVNQDIHKVVVMLDAQQYGFTSLSKATAFIEEQYRAVNEDYSKTFADIQEALTIGANEKADLRIIDIDTYVDTFLDEDDDDI